MYALLKPFVDLIFFRGKPQDIPASQSLLMATVLACLVTTLINSLKNTDFVSGFILSAGQIVLLAGFLLFFLNLHRKKERLAQTLTALFGALTLLNLLSLPFNAKLEVDAEGVMTASNGIILVSLIQVWFFVIMVRVIKESLDISTVRSVALSISISLGIMLVLAAFVTPPVATPATLPVTPTVMPPTTP